MSTNTAALLMTMTDIASLARVRRPVVSTWRSRAAASDAPFPAAALVDRGQELFDPTEISQWLARTGRGNNPDARADAAAHATPNRPATAADETFGAITALLALRTLLGTPLGHLDRDDLLDAADENDPDDLMLFREIESLKNPAELVRYVDDAVEAGYGEAAVFERLVSERARLSSPVDTLGPMAVRLMAQLVRALAETLPGEPVIADVIASSTDTVIQIATLDEVGADFSVFRASGESVGGDDNLARLIRRRLATHRISRSTVAGKQDASIALTGSVVHVVQLPAGMPEAQTSTEMLSMLDRIVLQLTSDQLAVVLAPAAVLSDAKLEAEADAVRSDLLRSGRVRAIVRLAPGLRPHKPRQAQALWIIGETAAKVELAERWTMIADLSAVRLDEVVMADLVSDLVASLGTIATVRAHAFRFARLVFTRTLLASRDSLVAAAHSTPKSSAGSRSARAALAVRVDDLLAALSEEAHAHEAASGIEAIGVEPRAVAHRAVSASVEQLIARGHLRYIPGNRVDPDDIVETMADAGGIRVIAADEVTGARPIDARRIDRLQFAGQYAAARLTEPGDVIFCTSPRPVAIVDREGASAVVFPARILRIDASDANGLLSDVLAADIAAVSAADRNFTKWMLRQVDHRQRDVFASALTSLRLQQERATTRLAQLDELTSLLITGVTGGSLTLTTASESSAPSEGTN